MFGRDGLDIRLQEYIGEAPGVFVEAGANDGVTESNTLLLERDRCWSGILIEPVPELAALCRRNRPGATVVEAALVARDFRDRVVRMTHSNLMSVVRGARGGLKEDQAFAEAGRELAPDVDVYELEVPARTLSSIFDEHDVEGVDLLSIDVEGYELNALAGLDLSRHCPRLLLIEVWAWNRQAIAAMLEPLYDEVAVIGALHTGEPSPPDVPWEKRSFEEILFRRRKRVPTFP